MAATGITGRLRRLVGRRTEAGPDREPTSTLSGGTGGGAPASGARGREAGEGSATPPAARRRGPAIEPTPSAGKAPAKTPVKKAAVKTPVKKAAVKKAPAKKAAVTKAPAKKAAAKKAAVTKAPAKKAAAKKAAVIKAAVTKVPATTVPATTVPAKKAAAKKTPATKAPATKTPVKKATATTPAPATRAISQSDHTPLEVSAAARTRTAEPPRTPASVSAGDHEAWTEGDLGEVRAQLEAQARELRGEIDDAESTSAALRRGAGGEGPGDEADAGSKTFEREHELSLANNSRDLLLQVERALARVDDGTYGRCESCGEAIPKARLQAFPRATLCVRCKQREERR